MVLEKGQRVNYLSDEYQYFLTGLIHTSSRDKGFCIVLNGVGALDCDSVLKDIERASGKALHRSQQSTESEQSLARLFNDPHHDRSILLFDEADALIGTRTEVKDSHDRYANIEVSYLLRQIEDFRGLVILASAQRQNLAAELYAELDTEIRFPLFATALRRMVARLVKWAS